MPDSRLVKKVVVETPKHKVRVINLKDIKRNASFLMSEIMAKETHSASDFIAFTKLSKTFIDASAAVDYKRQIRKLQEHLLKGRSVPAETLPPRKKATIPYALIEAQKKIDENRE